MDLFCEYIVKKQQTAKDYLIIAGYSMLALFLSFIILLFNAYMFGFGLLLIAGCWYGAFILTKMRYVEYEYILTNSYLDIDKIYAKRRRKRIMSMDFKHIDICAKADDVNFAHEYKNAPQKIYDFTGVCDNDIYFVDFSKDANKVRILFQPTEKMKDGLKLINPRNIHIV